MDLLECENVQSLSGLFYYDPSEKKYADLQKGLYEYRFLLSVASLAFQAMRGGELEKFDCLVGENACQIRAIRVALIALKRLDHLEDLIHKLAFSAKKVDEILRPESINRLMQQGLSLSQIIKENDLDIHLNEDEVFLVLAYFLTVMKETESNSEFMASLLKKERAVPNRWKVFYPEISSSFIDRLSSRMRRLLSIASVKFVQEAALHLKDPYLFEILSKFASRHNTWHCTPMFWTYKTLLAMAKKRDIPIILHVDFVSQEGKGFRVVEEKTLFFKPCSKAQDYLKTSPTENDLATPACIFRGIACIGQINPSLFKKKWNKDVETTSVIDMILAGAADHRQYPDPNRNIPVEDIEFENYKALAEKVGFSLSNPATFFIRHVYCALVKNEMPEHRKAAEETLRLTPRLVGSR